MPLNHDLMLRRFACRFGPLRFGVPATDGERH
jgi:hypothetical protein